MPCACSHGPSTPPAPNSRTKTRPEITGDTEKGRLISVSRNCLPRKLELGDRPGAAEADHDVEGHREESHRQRQPNRRHRIGFQQRLRHKHQGRAGRPAQRRRQAAETESASRNASDTAINSHRASSAFVGDARLADRGDDGAHVRHSPASAGSSFAARLISVRSVKDSASMTRRDDRGAAIVELLQPDDDEERRDLRHERQIAGHEDDRAVFADAAGEGERKAGQQSRR